jgi:uroporphyrinogen decarboxylase
MMDRTEKRGGYLIGTGNSVPAYMPQNKYLAMVKEAIGYDPQA